MTPFNPFSALTSKIFGGLAVILLLAAAVQTWRAQRFEAQRDEERAAHAETVRRVKAAQDQALAAAIAARTAAEARYRALAERMDRSATQTRRAAQDASERFLAAAPRCLRAEAAGGAPGRAAAPAADRAAGVPGGVPAASELVGVSPADVRAVGELAAYALSCRAWAVGLTR